MGPRRIGPLLTLLLLGAGAPLCAQEPGRGAPPSGEYVFSLESVVVTAPWPVIPPQYKEIARPSYPEPARRREQEGTVILLLRVGVDGHVEEAQLHQSSGHRLLDEAALEAARAWTFVPARQGPRPVEAWVHVPVRFELK